MSDAEEARFRAFIEATDAGERDWIAFCEFSEAASRGAMAAAMINPYDGEKQGGRELHDLRVAISEMLFRVLPRIELGTLLGEVEGIGYAIRYGIIAQRPDALDGVGNTEEFQALAEKGYAADRAESERRMADMAAHHAAREKRAARRRGDTDVNKP